MTAGQYQEPMLGRHLLRASWAATLIFLIVTSLAVLSVDRFGPLAATIDMILFLVGSVLFLIAFAVAVGRSRTELIGVGGLYFLAGCAPKKVQRVLLGSAATEVLAGLAGAIARPFTLAAFGVLVPIFGLGIAGLWGARHGTFPDR